MADNSTASMAPLQPDANRAPAHGGRSYENDCAICLESVSHTTSLPCSCNVSYCTRCWDQALAQSYKFCGQARCPTCRTPVRVDFDPNTHCLIFSRSEVAPTEDDTGEVTEETRIRAYEMTVIRLLEQARPAQVRLLQQYGAADPALQTFARDAGNQLLEMPESELRGHIAVLEGDSSTCTSKQDLINCLQTITGDTSALVAFWAANKMTSPPPCVCGSILERISGKARIRNVVCSILPGYAPGSDAFQMVYNQLLTANSYVKCDLCNREFSQSEFVWTCNNGDSTILHATSYDFCDQCFAQHACGVAVA